ncbi:hypothetical protein [uncultured Alistipes sp.]|uniref:hypothetical protein n=1 Tax=uncultured Alistipes sp. TaxID=538949 RepID=UPI00272D1DAF|nr:hypothetical protein [uncultured Alistipes sp.]
MDERTNIELRSEKVRSIVGKMPPFLLRMGISIIAGVILVVLGLLYYIPYQQTITIPVKISFYNEDSTSHAESHIPLQEVRSIQIEQNATITIQSLQGNYNIYGQVYKLAENNGFVDIDILLTDTASHSEHLSTLPTGVATIHISRKPILKRIIKKS